MYCLFSREPHKYDPTGRQTGVSASQTCQQGDGSLLLMASSERLRERVAAGTLRSDCTWCWGGREGGRERKNWKELFFFPACDKSCSHMGGTRPSDLTEGWLEWSQWSVQSGGVTLSNRQQPSRPACRRRASVNEIGRKLVPPLSTIASKAFPRWSTWASTSAALWFYKPTEM